MPPTSVRELDDDSVALVLEAYVDQTVVVQRRNPCSAGLDALCAALYGPARYGPGTVLNEALWKYACGRFGLQQRLEDSTWRATFQALCRELQIMQDGAPRDSRELEMIGRMKPEEVPKLRANRRARGGNAVSTFLAYAQGRGAELDISREQAAFTYIDGYPLLVFRKAFLGVGAIERTTQRGIGIIRALESGDVDKVKAAIGTGVHAGAQKLFINVNRLEEAWDEESGAEKVEYVRLLLAAGVRANTVRGGSTALAKAVEAWEAPYKAGTELVRVLLEAGADPNYGGMLYDAGCIYGWCPRHPSPPLTLLVMKYDHYVHEPHLPWRSVEDVLAKPLTAAFLERTRLLLDAGADPTLPDAKGRTALALAEEKRDERTRQTNEDWVARFWVPYVEMLKESARARAASTTE